MTGRPKRAEGPQDVRRLLREGPPVTAATRTVMLANRGRDTGPEMAVRRALHAAGLRFRLHDRRLPGRPDVVLASRRLVVEVRGCFWHGHACLGGRVPKTRSAFWVEKVRVNKARDARNEGALRDLGWDVLVVWECDLRRGGPGSVVEDVLSRPVTGAPPRREPPARTPVTRGCSNGPAVGSSRSGRGSLTTPPPHAPPCPLRRTPNAGSRG